MHEAAVKVKQICENLERRTTDEHFALIFHTTEKSKEKEFTKKPPLYQKSEKLKNTSGTKSTQKATYTKQAVINLTDTN